MQILDNPTREQKLLLQAAFSEPLLAKEAWESYCQAVDLQTTDSDSLSLLPLVYRNLSTSPLPAIQFCKGKYKHTWCSNHDRWKELLPLFAQWIAIGIDQIVFLGAMAMTLNGYKDFGIKRIGIIDLLIRKQHFPLVHSLLLDAGWKLAPNLLRKPLLSFTHPTGEEIHIHNSFLPENNTLDNALFDAAMSLLIPAPGLTCPAPSDLFFQICIQGIQQNPHHPIRWMADAMTLLKHHAIDWERVTRFAQETRHSFLLSQALNILSISSPVLKSQTLESLEYRALLSGRYRVSGWYRFCLNRNYLSPFRFLHLPQYFKLHAITYLQLLTYLIRL